MLVLVGFSVGLALAIALWAYGVYCYVQMVRHRRPGVSPLELAWTPERLTPLGLAYRRRALRSSAAFVLIAVALMVLGRVAAAVWRERAG